MARVMKCGHNLSTYDFQKIDDMVFIKWKCVDGCETDWERVGIAPDPEETPIHPDWL